MNYHPHPWLGNYNVRKDKATYTITVYADIFIYGNKASEKVAIDISRDVRDAWNAARAKITVNGKSYTVRFAVRGYYTTSPQNWITGNWDYKKVFMRVEDHTDAASGIQISYMDGIGSNSGVFPYSEHNGRAFHYRATRNRAWLGQGT
jgi:hypothetical protein